MIPVESVKRELLKEIDKLPDHQLQSVLSFVHALLLNADRSYGVQQSQEQPSVQVDPLADFIGAVSHGSLAQEYWQEKAEVSVLSESSLAKDWLTPEEDEAWQDL